MTAFKLEPAKSLAVQIAARLRQAIIEGELALGSQIPEETLAQSFGVSRTPVREALNQLQLQGLVHVRPQVGSFVFYPTVDDVTELCQFRCVIEPRAAELAYRNDKISTVGAIEAAIAEMESAVKRRDTVAYGRADTSLHEAMFTHCGNTYLQESYKLAAGKIAALRTNLSAPLDVRSPDSFSEHRKFLKLFIKGDFEAFEKLMIVHVKGSGDTYVRALQTKAARDPAA
ncbi:GntR family transcriptional regulator [Polaromonas jejuensis]|uniref:GntR family transcriptional regulator n=2 Tax=Polaromonas jejuensis TaxID=457502 RepID=A0ABW0QBG8_9BURK|nr:GntR family transcriptional regulator [Polaromonas jejuensis]